MRKILIGLSICLLPFLFTSCFREADLGYPDTVTFPGEGGVETITGNTAYTHAEIHDYKTGESGEVHKTEDGTFYNVHRWLKVEYKAYDGNNKDLIIHAEPNTTGKSRTLYIELYSGPEYATVKVVQDK